MLLTKTTRRIATWLAMAAVALNALWPLIANAKPGYADFAQEICSVVMRDDAGRYSPSDAPTAKHLAKHCAFCSAGGNTNVIPAYTAVPAVIQTEAEESRPDFAASCTPAAPDHHPAQPRAPPSAS